MDWFRAIQPRQLPPDQYLQVHPRQEPIEGGEINPKVPQDSKRNTRQRHTEDEWEGIRPHLAELILSHSLVDAIDMIKQTYNFEAGLRAYRNKIAEWGLKQHQSAEELGIVVAKRDKRKREGKATVVIAKGEQLAMDRLDLFQRRAKDKQSPSAPTPQSIEYFTPANNGLTPDTLRSPAALRSTILRQGILNPAAVNQEHKDICKKLLILDQTMQPVVVLRPLDPPELPNETDTGVEIEEETGQIVTRAENATTSSTRHPETMKVQMTPGTQIEALRTRTQVPQRPLHDLHQSGRIAIVGRGRFAKKEKPLRLLWQMKELCQDMHKSLQQAALSGKATLPGQQMIAAGSISYIVRARGKSVGIKEEALRLINFCQLNDQIHNVLGLTKQDRVRWLNSWSEVAEGDGTLIIQTANHLFGDLTNSYPEMDTLEVLIFLHTTAPRRDPILLRAAAGWDPCEEHRRCLYCDDEFQIVDFMSSSGAVKLHHSAFNSTTIFEPFSTFDSFRKAFADSHETIFPKHYINVFDEHAANTEEFDPSASSYIRVSFEPFPAEDEITLLYGANGRTRPAKETWDPSGVENSEEEFDPYPEAEHEYVSDTKAVKFND